MAKRTLDVSIISPEETIFKGKAQAVSCQNPKGSFDVLAEHTNFMSMIEKKITILEENGNNRDIPIDQALIQVKNNVVTVLVNIQISQKDSFLTNLFKKQNKNIISDPKKKE